MQFTAVQNFTSLAELLRFYGDADEIVFNSHTELSEAEIAEACHDGRWLANRLRLRNGSKPVEEIAASYGCRVVREPWQVAEGKMIFLGECLLRKNADLPQEGDMLIRVNSEATKSLAELMTHWANEAERHWFSDAKISEVVIAHELFHLLEQKPHSTKLELAAHAFARAIIELPFSPLLYNALLLRLATGKKTLTI
ncbi:MAG TPA: hypothetical protein PLK30_04665 [Blastocatellia bacterium]|nr:hypothetical protein [Blastocatellia bacterium]